MTQTPPVQVLLAVALAAADKATVTTSPLQAEGRGDPERDLQDMDGDSTDTKMMAAGAGAGAAAMHGHGKFFQDFYSLQYGPRQVEFGHVCEDPNEWEQRFERKDLDKSHHQGQVRWGDKHGGYGEHYWDYNHGGHHGDGDGGGEGSAPVPDIAEQVDDAPRPQYKRQSFLDQSGAASGVAASGAESPGGRRAYRKKYVARPTTTTVAPTHPVPRPRTTSRPPPQRQPPSPPPTVGMAAKSSKTAFFPADFPGSVFQGGVPTSATTAALAPRNARQTPGQTQDAAGLVRRLAFDPRTGRVHDEDTGQVFVLQPVS
ncbi:uncharacterized protein LOC117643451 [Thrips palmi]|uniref:Uncharacterized protein LOC117643451 n=1 Tax=Thrips palmi TaxID=161013 RepID=A0A6P8YMA1_THRPL|nr:uncharacterized protein LOC117643451 [Thrips palmi]